MHFIKEIGLFIVASAFLLWILEWAIADGVADGIAKSGVKDLDLETQIENAVREALGAYFKERGIAKILDRKG